MASTILIRIPATPEPQQLTLPGGVSIEHLELVQVTQPPLTPLMPFFNFLDAVLATFDAVKAVPDSLGPPPDPSALIKAIQKLAEKIANGEVGLNTPGLKEHLWQTTMDKLAVDQPNYASYERELGNKPS